MNIWIINPFDELPGDTDIRHRYWALAETLAEMGHTVTWWSSDFSHRHKRYRTTPVRPASSSAFTREDPRPAPVRSSSVNGRLEGARLRER
ncbi:MAG: hypothetical protein ACP5I4_16490 [Oceanipulchritudo sp.]